VGGSAEAVLFLRVWVLVMALATRDAAHGCVWVVTLWGVLRGVGLAHGVAITPVLLLFRELNTVTVYDKAAVCDKAVRVWWSMQKGWFKRDVQRLIKRLMAYETMNPTRLWLKITEH